MIINAKNYSIQIAVGIFFMTSCLGSVFGLSPLTCSKRGLISAFITYGLSRCAIKVVNKIILNALVKSQLTKQGDSHSGNLE